MTTDLFIKELHRYIPGSISFDSFWIYRHDGEKPVSEILNKPCRINATALIICTEGSMELSYNFRTVRMEKNTVFVSHPHNSLNVLSAVGCKGYILAMEESGFTDYTIDPKHIPELIDKIYDYPLVSITEDESRKICRALDALSDYIRDKTDSPFKSSIIRSGMSTFVYILMDSLYSHMASIECERKTMNREKEHFNRFLKILSENYLKEREVKYYADRMNLTPRYLTTTIRKVSGHTVSEWISRFIIKDAKYLLNHSMLTVQQIAYELNFPNQSFFGKFFKKHVGMSPGAYRNNSTSSQEE
ncbi:MAG: AraC family transcriptional regulator [Bacteroidales bacterium]|nr:AraC family transcriptional regulator [Bacteroidales bacterium]